MSALEHAWYQPRLGWTRWLLPLAWLFRLIVALRRRAYRIGWLASGHPGVPVMVVGNLTVGGTGKTPLVAAIAQQLQARGWRPGIVSRGYGGRVRRTPVAVTVDSDVAIVGDEPLLLARRAGCPVVVCRDRLAAARQLVSHDDVDVVIADDGLQHYTLQRDAEIAVHDLRRGYGNRCTLPAGPLREPLSRLAEVDLEFTQGEEGDYKLRAVHTALPVGGCAAPRVLSGFVGRPLHAVAGIGDPDRFFCALRALGLTLCVHPFPDHHAYTPDDLAFSDDAPLLMTEKDAVKCAAFARPNWWYLPVDAQLTPAAQARLEQLYNRVLEAA